MEVERVAEVDEDLIVGMNRLLPQLSSSAAPVSRAWLEELVASPAASLLVVREGTTILGTTTLITFPIPTGRRAWIEDVVVDEAARGRGVGEALVREALRIAKRAGCRTVDLTSRASRVAAHALYERVGFTLRETNVYRHSLED